MSKKLFTIIVLVVIASALLSACGTQTSMMGINNSPRTEGCDFGQLALIEHDFRSVATEGVLDMTVDEYLNTIMPKYSCISK